MDTPELPNLGQHCYVADCNQIDFLPFTCNRCHQTFCLEHRSYRQHNCPEADEQGHAKTVCDPATNKRKCPVSGCSVILALSNTVKCKDCDNDHCLIHRFGPDHKCPGKPSKVEQSSSSRGTTTSTTTETPQWQTVDVCLQCDRSFTSLIQLLDHVQDVHPTIDECPLCNREFTDLLALVEHVQMDHSDD